MPSAVHVVRDEADGGWEVASRSLAPALRDLIRVYCGHDESARGWVHRVEVVSLGSPGSLTSKLSTSCATASTKRISVPRADQTWRTGLTMGG